MPMIVGTYLTEDEEQLILLGLKALSYTLPKEHPQRKAGEAFAAALGNDTWLVTTTVPPDLSDSDD